MSKASPIIYSSNQFDVATRDSKRKMNVASEDCLTRLKGMTSVPEASVLHAYFKPIRAKYETDFSNHLSKQGEAVAATQKVYELLTDLSGPVIRRWEPRVASAYDDHSSKYRQYFPNGKKPFYTKGIDQRIAVVRAFYTSVSTDTGLAHVAADVAEFLEILDTARKNQNTLSGSLKDLSVVLEQQRKDTAAAMYYITGQLMGVHKDNPAMVDNYFDAQLLRDDVAGEETEELVPAAVLSIAAGSTVESGLTIVPEIRLRLVNSGASELRVCMSDDPTTPCTDSVGKVLKPAAEMEATPALLGNPDGGFLNITNLSATLMGELQVFVLEG